MPLPYTGNRSPRQLVRLAKAAQHRDFALDNRLSARGEDRSVDLARRDRVDAHAERAEMRSAISRVNAVSAAFEVA
jgi:hypothetical protein